MIVVNAMALSCHSCAKKTVVQQIQPDSVTTISGSDTCCNHLKIDEFMDTVNYVLELLSQRCDFITNSIHDIRKVIFTLNTFDHLPNSMIHEIESQYKDFRNIKSQIIEYSNSSCDIVGKLMDKYENAVSPSTHSIWFTEINIVYSPGQVDFKHYIYNLEP